MPVTELLQGLQGQRACIYRFHTIKARTGAGRERRARGGARPSCGGEPAAAGAPAGGSTRNAKSASRARGKGLPCGAAATAAALASTHLRARGRQLAPQGCRCATAGCMRPS